MIRPIIIIILIILPFLIILAHKNYLNKKKEISSLNLIYISLIAIYVFFIFKLADAF